MNEKQRLAREEAKEETWTRRRRAKELFDEFDKKGLDEVQVRGFDENIALNDTHEFKIIKDAVSLVFLEIYTPPSGASRSGMLLPLTWLKQAKKYVHLLKVHNRDLTPYPSFLMTHIMRFEYPENLTVIGRGDGVERERNCSTNRFSRDFRSANIYDTFLRMRYIQLAFASCFTHEVTESIRSILTRFHGRTNDVHPFDSCVEIAVRSLVLIANHRFDRALELQEQSAPGLKNLQSGRRNNPQGNKEKINRLPGEHPLCVHASNIFSLLSDTEMDYVYGISVPYFEQTLDLADSTEEQQIINDFSVRWGLDAVVEKYRILMEEGGENRNKMIFKANFQRVLSPPSSIDIINEVRRGGNIVKELEYRRGGGQKSLKRNP